MDGASVMRLPASLEVGAVDGSNFGVVNRFALLSRRGMPRRRVVHVGVAKPIGLPINVSAIETWPCFDSNRRTAGLQLSQNHIFVATTRKLTLPKVAIVGQVGGKLQFKEARNISLRRFM